MNAQTRLTIDARILGDGSLQERFTDYVWMLGYIMRRASRPVSVEQLEDMSDRPAAALRRRLQELAHAGILEKSVNGRQAWRLAKGAGELTLEHVFRCAVTACSTRPRHGPACHARPDSGRDVEVLLQQALQTVDDHLYKSLRTYSLDRFIVSAVPPFPARQCDAVPLFTEID